MWGVTIGGTVLQNELTKRLPSEFAQLFPKGVSIAYASIPVIKTLEEPLRSEVRRAFTDSIRVIYQVLIGIAGLGFLISLPMKALPLHTQMDEKWGMDEETGRAGSDEIALSKTGADETRSVLPQLD